MQLRLTSLFKKFRKNHFSKRLRSEGKFELRSLDKEVCARIKVNGSLKESLVHGRKLLLEYFEGNNFKSLKIKKPKKIYQTWTGEGWVISLPLPAEYIQQQEPKPVNRSVEVVRVPSRKVGVFKIKKVSFSTFFNASEKLKIWLIRNEARPSDEVSLVHPIHWPRLNLRRGCELFINAKVTG